MPRPRIAVSLTTALAAAVLLSGAAKPQPSRWSREPTAADHQAARDAAGVKPGATGRAVAACKATADGGLEACHVVLESPIGAGFAKAALALAPRYRLNLASPKAPKVGEEVLIDESWFPVDTPPDWRRRPNGADLMSVWPTQALARGIGGKATINCMISVQGGLYECFAVSESPPGEHFGAAAVALAPQFLMKPAMLQGRPVISPVSIPINFATPESSFSKEELTAGKGMVSAAMAWAEAPGYAAVAAAYPARAKAAKVGGHATLNCEFNGEGRLRNCETIAEEPRHEDFANAAKVLAKQFRAPATTVDGHPIAGVSVQLPVVFDPAMLEGGQPLIGKAQWASLPSLEDTAAAFGKLKASGTTRVRLACTVLQGGAVTGCKVEQEEPAGQGVGEAALTLAPHFRLTTWTAEGLPTVGGTINIPLRYEPDPPPAAAPKG